jgi:hypothetical protein
MLSNRIDVTKTINCALKITRIELMIYRKTPYLVPRSNRRNKFFSKLFIRGLDFMNKVFFKKILVSKIHLKYPEKSARKNFF